MAERSKTTILKEVKENGQILELGDRTGRSSKWRIWPSDITTTILWLPSSEIEITKIEHEYCSHLLINHSTSGPEEARAIRASRNWPDKGLREKLKEAYLTAHLSFEPGVHFDPATDDAYLWADIDDGRRFKLVVTRNYLMQRYGLGKRFDEKRAFELIAARRGELEALAEAAYAAGETELTLS